MAALITLSISDNRAKAVSTIAAISISSVLTAIAAILALTGQIFEYQTEPSIFGPIRFCMDGLAAWFSLIISVVFCLGAYYGWGYMQHYREHKQDIGLHIFAYLLAYASMQMLCIVQHSLAFLIAWELMALSCFVLIVFESWKPDVMKAGINFFIQSHVSVLFLTLGFLLMNAKTGSFDFASLQNLEGKDANTVYLLLFFGFAVKAGLLPFHTWLPHAHPAAPAHVSGVMSGVIIKIGIFGMLRMLSFAHIDYCSIGYLILCMGAISGLYGIMLGIVQKNLKKLLAYSSIENIGIICMGIGLGLVGLGSGMPVMSGLGFAAALLHTLNHALFKSSLFFLAGNVYHATHTLNMEQLGGLSKKMPWTGLFFLFCLVAICALPPMNGFVSEFMLYSGLLRWMQEASLTGSVGAAFSIMALSLIGGLAIICFTKAYGISFLGEARSDLHEVKELPAIRLVPIAISLVLMLSIGLCPWWWQDAMQQALCCLPQVPAAPAREMPLDPLVMAKLSLACLCFIAIAAFLHITRNRVQAQQKIQPGDTWGCAYTAPNAKMQYTGSSYVKTYSDTMGGLLGYDKNRDNYDKLERNLIDKPLAGYQKLMSHFLFLQNGKLQFYMLYGIVFVLITIIITFIIH